MEIENMLKINFKQYGRKLIGYLAVLGEDADATARPQVSEELDEQARKIAQFFTDFEQLENANNRSEIFDFARSRLDDLRLILLEAGFNPRNPEELIQRFKDDPECKSGYAPLLKEIFWQLNALVLDISRHWPDKTRTEKEIPWLGMIEQVMDRP
ncbi:MAG: hypothetical protein WCA64_09270 [Gallionella sp.]